MTSMKKMEVKAACWDTVYFTFETAKDLGEKWTLHEVCDMMARIEKKTMDGMDDALTK